MSKGYIIKELLSKVKPMAAAFAEVVPHPHQRTIQDISLVAKPFTIATSDDPDRPIPPEKDKAELPAVAPLGASYAAAATKKAAPAPTGGAGAAFAAVVVPAAAPAAAAAAPSVVASTAPSPPSPAVDLPAAAATSRLHHPLG